MCGSSFAVSGILYAAVFLSDLIPDVHTRVIFHTFMDLFVMASV
jgi:hypothetical protein